MLAPTANERDLWKKLYPWFIWLLSSSFIFYKYLLQVSPSAMVHELMSQFVLNGSQMSNITASYFYAYFLMQLPAGLMLDRFSVKRLMASAIIVCALGAYLCSVAESLWVINVSRALVGIGGAFSAVGTMKLISVWFKPRQFALVSGLMMTMAMLGAVSGQGPIAYMVSNYGWRNTLLFAAILGVVLAALLSIFIRENRIRRIVERQTTQHIKKGFSKIIANPQSWLIAFYSGLAFSPISAFAGLWGVPFIIKKYHFSHTHAAAWVSLIFIGFAIGSPTGGWLSDRIKRRKPIMIFGTLTSLLLLIYIIYCPNLTPTALGAAFLACGYSCGCFFVSFAHIREIHAENLSGTSIGFINMFNALFGAISTTVVGKALDIVTQHLAGAGHSLFSITDYQYALSSLIIGLSIALLLQCFIRETYCQQTQ